MDPASALIVPLSAGEDGMGPRVCDRTLRVFGGFFRSDIEMSYARTEEFRDKGYSRPVTVCSASYVPIAGHRRESAMDRFMSNDRGIEVRLALVQGALLVMLVSATVPMPVGTTTIELEESHARAAPHLRARSVRMLARFVHGRARPNHLWLIWGFDVELDPVQVQRSC